MTDKHKVNKHCLHTRSQNTEIRVCSMKLEDSTYQMDTKQYFLLLHYLPLLYKVRNIWNNFVKSLQILSDRVGSF